VPRKTEREKLCGTRFARWELGPDSALSVTPADSPPQLSLVPAALTSSWDPCCSSLVLLAPAWHPNPQGWLRFVEEVSGKGWAKSLVFLSFQPKEFLSYSWAVDFVSRWLDECIGHWILRPAHDYLRPRLPTRHPRDIWIPGVVCGKGEGYHSCDGSVRFFKRYRASLSYRKRRREDSEQIIFVRRLGWLGERGKEKKEEGE